MMETPTVLVLGAGASVPYGFPTAEKLRRRICGYEEAVPIARICKAIGNIADVDQTGYERFVEEFKQARSPSIDSFLEHRREYEKVGKAVIAYLLIQKETSKNLDLAEQENKGDWYKHLLTMMNAPFDKFHENKLSILTFNYDRSLEEYIVRALRARFKKTRSECMGVLKNIPIIHLHGSLGRFPSGDDDAPANWYGGGADGVTETAIRKSIAEIKIVHENLEADETASSQFLLARKMLITAERICFLGFGFHEDNLRRLNTKMIESNVRIMASSLGLSDGFMKKIASEHFPHSFKWDRGKEGKGCLEFLQERYEMQ